MRECINCEIELDDFTEFEESGYCMCCACGECDCILCPWAIEGD